MVHHGDDDDDDDDDEDDDDDDDDDGDCRKFFTGTWFERHSSQGGHWPQLAT